MITNLSDITMKEFIPLLWGDYSGLNSEEEKDSDEDVRKAASDMVYKFKSIVDPTRVKISLIESEEEARVKCRLLIGKILHNLHAVGAWSDVRELLPLIGLPSDTPVDKMGGVIDRFKAEQEYMMKRISDRKKEDEAHGQTLEGKDEISAHFDEITAGIMAQLKIQINLSEVTAGVYANLYRRTLLQIKELNKLAEKWKR